MKIRLADYVACFLVEKGVTDVFSVVGGGAMHLNDALGHKEGLKVTYNHHEQACAIAAEAYARLDNKIAAVCVTTGPGGTNAITGVLGGWLDSIPMFIISGQVRYDTTARYAMQFTDGLPLRAVGDQEYDIVKSVAPMTKYAVMIEDPLDIRFALEKAWHLATTGRPGPVWIDIPVNYQGMYIDTDELTRIYDPEEDDKALPPEVTDDVIASVIDKIRNAKRPVFHAGYGIRLSGGYEAFRKVMEKLGIPVVTYWNAVDLIEDDHQLYCGRAGNMGDRPGNWAIQNADLILAVGTRISIRQVGYNWKTWAREAEVIMVDIDKAEMKKHTIHVDMPIWADANDFLNKLDKALGDSSPAASGSKYLSQAEDWRKVCLHWRESYPVVTDKNRAENGKTANVYDFVKHMSSLLPENSLTAVSNGACCVVGNQTYVIKKGSRMANNSAVASMGYGLPAAIGTCIGGGRRQTICLEGDGSIMMNLQELQTIITNQLPIKIFLINNEGYHSIRITQTNIFSEHTKVGIGEESGDLSFPSYRKIARAFGYPYYSASSNKEMREVVEKVLKMEGPVFCEIFTDTQQVWEPKSGTRKLEDGSLVSPPLEDLAPFLPREELEKIMIVPMVEEGADNQPVASMKAPEAGKSESPVTLKLPTGELYKAEGVAKEAETLVRNVSITNDYTEYEEYLRAQKHSIRNYKLFLTDCDGCLTDSGMYYTEKGDEIKKFSTRDGVAFRLLKEKGVITGVITGEDVELNRRRCRKLKIDILASGCNDKASCIRRLCDEYNISPEEIVYIGDDLLDLEAIKMVGLGCCPADANYKVKAEAKYITRAKGGEGVIREVVDMLFEGE